jgi:hypothetical protein
LTLCCRAQYQSTSGQNKANSILVEKAGKNKGTTVATQPRPRPSCRVDCYSLCIVVKDSELTSFYSAQRQSTSGQNTASSILVLEKA